MYMPIHMICEQNVILLHWIYMIKYNVITLSSISTIFYSHGMSKENRCTDLFGLLYTVYQSDAAYTYPKPSYTPKETHNTGLTP
jgi:hypothetical protein